MIPERYALLRGVDTLGKVKSNIDSIKYLYGKHKGNWSITTTVTKMTELDDVINIMNFAHERGFMFAIRPYITVSGTAGRKDEKLSYGYEDVLEIFDFMLDKTRRENYIESLILEEHINYIKGCKMPECDALNYSFLMKETGKIAPCLEMPGRELEIDSFDDAKNKYSEAIRKCNCETPCFYNCAREIGFLWRKKWKAAAHVIQIISQMKKYGNFF